MLCCTAAAMMFSSSLLCPISHWLFECCGLLPASCSSSIYYFVIFLDLCSLYECSVFLPHAWGLSRHAIPSVG